MTKQFTRIIIPVLAILLYISATAVAAPTWVVMDETTTAMHLVDKDTVKLNGDTDRELELWMKSVFKDRPGYMVAHYLVKENDLSFILKERTFYSGAGEVTNTFTNQTDKWNAPSPNSPIGRVAKKLLSEYQQNPQAFDNGKLSSVDAAKVQAQVVDPQVLKKARDEGRIKQDSKNDSKWFYVRDTFTEYYFLDKHHMTADFCLLSGSQAKRLMFSTEDSRHPGAHSLKSTIVIRVDDREWLLSSPMTSDSGGYTSVYFKNTYNLPDTLINALLQTQNDVVIKWQYSFIKDWKDYQYVIPAKTISDIKLMYSAGGQLNESK